MMLDLCKTTGSKLDTCEGPSVYPLLQRVRIQGKLLGGHQDFLHPATTTMIHSQDKGTCKLLSWKRNGWEVIGPDSPLLFSQSARKRVNENRKWPSANQLSVR